MDTACKFRVASFESISHGVYLCHVGHNIVLSPQQKNSFAAGVSQFFAHVGCFPKVLVADRASEILSKRLGLLLTAKLVKVTPVAGDDYFRNGGAEKAIQDIDFMTTCLMADHNLPKDCWDIVGEHASLLNACLYPCPSNPSITTYECETG